MEAFKITLFEQENGGPFPVHRSLSAAEGQVLRDRLAQQWGLTFAAPMGAFARALASRQTYYPEVNAEDDFDLLATLTALDIAPLPELFLNWGQFEAVNVFQTADVARYFDDLWYPAADDLDLFDASLRWVVSIRHDGVVSFVR
jgi:hypothetical protein